MLAIQNDQDLILPVMSSGLDIELINMPLKM